MKFKGFIIGMAITAGIVGAFDAGIAITRSLAENHYSQQLEVKDESLASYLEQLSTLQQQLDEALSNGETDAETISELQSQIATLKVEIQTLQAQLEKDPDKTYIDDVLSGDTFYTFKSLNGEIFLSTDASTKSGIYVVNEDFSVTKVYDKSYSFEYFNELSNGNILISNTVNNSTGLLLYNYETKEVTQIYNKGYNYQYFCELSNGDALISSLTSNYGVLLYKASTNEVTQIGSQRLSNFKELKNGNVLMSSLNGGSPGTGLYMLDTTTNKISQIYETGNWSYYTESTNGNVLISSGSSVTGNNGILLYNITTNEVSQIYTGGYAWGELGYAFSLDNGDILLSNQQATKNSGLLLYNAETNQITKIFDNEGWQFYYKLKTGNVLITNNHKVWNKKPLLYDASTKTVKELGASGLYLDTFVEDENGVTISSTKSDSKLYYSYETGECTKIS